MSFLLGYCDGLPEVRLESGTRLLNEGEKSNKLFILIDGELQILRGDIEIGTISDPGSVFGELSILLDAPHTASVRALSASRVYVVDDVDTFLASTPEVMRHIGKLLALRLNSVTGYLADLKRQFADKSDHLGMVDEVLESLLHQQDSPFTPGSDREADPRL